MTHALKTKGLSKSYGAVSAVSNVTIEVEEGDVVALLGPNGAGKTTTLDLALGLIHPDSGTSQIFGMSPKNAVKRGLVALVQQGDALIDDLSVRGVLKIVAATMKEPRPVDEVMEYAGITHLAKRRVAKCSGGEKQRIRLALGLLSNPRLLVLDEPTTGMDVASRQDFWKFIEAQAASGMSIIFATHYLAEAQDYAVRTVIMREGRVIMDKPTQQLREQYALRHLTISMPESAVNEAVRYVEHLEYTRKPNGIHVKGKNLDDVARRLLAIEGAHDLELVTASLEDAYTNLVENK